MFWKNAVAVSLAALPLIEAHPGSVPGAPKLFGLRSVNELRSRVAQHGQSKRAAEAEAYAAAAPAPAPQPANLFERQANPNTCGPGVGSCSAGNCCSPAGYCGTGPDYCTSPDCQLSYGPACDGNKVPPGPKTSNVARTKVGNVPYGGAGVYDCTTTGQVAITYDDGPYIYTSHILDLLDQYNSKATFFITGNNLGKGEIDDSTQAWPGLIKRMDQTGHQICSHTWSHQDLSAITAAQRLAQMYNNEIAFNNILGKFPTYMRPPYSSCTGDCQTVMAQLGYHVIYFDLDSEDYLHDSPNLIQLSKNDFSGNLSSSTPAQTSWLEISHDIHYQTAYNLTEFMLITLKQQGYTPVTVGQCLGDPPANWYRTLGGGALYTPSATSGATTAATGAAATSSSAPVAKVSGPVSQDATCGANNGGNICLGSQFGNCCSPGGWCGSSSDYCGTGCQAAYGNCGSNNPSGAASSAAVSSAASQATKPVSQDATCGSNNGGNTCLNSSFGNCCSPGGWCGSSADYCGTGCQAGYGNCGSNNPSVAASSAAAAKTSSAAVKAVSSPAAAKASVAPSKAAASPSSAPLVKSPDATCGGNNKYTCSNSGFGNCCSQNGWCGSTSDYCGTGCQTGFGSCSVSGGSSGASSNGGTTTTAPPPSATSKPAAASPTKSKNCLFTYWCF